MKTFFCILTLLLSSPANAGEEECIFDQKAQVEAYIELEKKYTGSTYLKKENHLIIPTDEGKITLRRGGCVHFGITIDLQVPKTTKYNNEDKFFAKILELATTYGYEVIDKKILTKIIKDKNWQNLGTEQDDGAYYFLPYKGLSAFEAYMRHDDKYTVISASFYN